MALKYREKPVIQRLIPRDVIFVRCLSTPTESCQAKPGYLGKECWEFKSSVSSEEGEVTVDGEHCCVFPEAVSRHPIVISILILAC